MSFPRISIGLTALVLCTMQRTATAQTSSQPSGSSASASSSAPSTAGTLPGVTGMASAPARLDTPARDNGYVPPPATSRISFNMEDASLPDVLRAISNITGRRFILAGQLRSIRITIYSPTPVTIAEAYQAFVSALAANGMTVVSRGRYSTIEESTAASSLPLAVFVDGQEMPEDSQFITRVHHLRTLPAAQAASLLAQLKSRDGSITVQATTNTLVVTDSGENIRRMLMILDAMETPPVRRVQLPTVTEHGTPAARPTARRER